MNKTAMPQNWIDFSATLDEMRAHALGDFTPVYTPEPECPKTVRVGGTQFYATDGSNMFLLNQPPRPSRGGRKKPIYKPRTDWINAARRQPPRTPLGWSVVMGRPLFWLHENFVLPGHIAAWVLWRHRDSRTIWRAGDPESEKIVVPAGIWASEDPSAPAVAYVMPLPSDNQPRWSELRHGTA